LEHQVALRTDGQIVAERAGEQRPVEAARRGTRDDVDDDAQLDLAADLAQQLEVDRLRIVLAVFRVGLIQEGGVGSLRPVGNSVQRAGGADELQDLLADAMHVDGERDAAEADERNAKLLFTHGPSWRPASAADLKFLYHLQHTP